MTDTNPLLLRAEEIPGKARAFSHPWNVNSAVTTAFLGRTLGLRRTGVNLTRVAPGKESFLPHSHQREEEWVYILAGNIHTRPVSALAGGPLRYYVRRNILRS